jgi:hypothetical protein
MNRTHIERSLKAVSLGMMALLLAGCPALLGSGVTSVTGGDHVTVTPASGVGDIVISATAEKGDKGDQGVQGIQGLQGAKGDTGAQGPQGAKGDTGAQGSQGLQGVKGDAGPRGLQGLKGDTGAQGAQGLPGEKGDTGAQGAQGPQGEKGDTGPQGPGGVQISGPVFSSGTGNYEIPDGTSISPPGLVVNDFVASGGGRPIMIQLVPQDNSNAGRMCLYNNGVFYIRVMRDLQQIGYVIYQDDVAGSRCIPPSVSMVDTGADAGTHIYSIQATASGCTTAFRYCRLMVMQL